MGDWRDRARCAGEPIELFFTEDVTTGTRHRVAKPTPHVQAMCNACPVGGECLSEALLRGEVGIWGGTTDAQRLHMKKARWRIACLKCSGRTIVRSRTYAVCMSCGLSWRAPVIPGAGSSMPSPTPRPSATHCPQSSTPPLPLAPPQLAPAAA